jgi:hypothetical protein
VTTENIYTKEYIEKKIIANRECIYDYMSSDRTTIEIHPYSEKGKDYPRMSFILFCLARASLVEASSSYNISKKEVGLFFITMYTRIKDSVTTTELLYIQLYGMRTLVLCDYDIDELCNDFKNGEHASLFTHPLLTSCFMSTYKECPQLKELFPFSEELFIQGQKTFDLILHSEKKDNMPPFFFSELSNLKGYIDDEICKAMRGVIDRTFDVYIESPLISSSGVAKCMEDFARIGDMVKFGMCENVLKKRSNTIFKDMRDPKEIRHSDVIALEEGESSRYFCLDTQAHLLQAYTTLYESL